MSWCFAPLDTDGVAIVEPIGFSLQINGGSDLDLGIVLPIGAPNAQGLAYYEATPARLTAGTITLKAYTASLGMSAQSVPITLTLLGSPQSPSNPGIVR